MTHITRCILLLLLLMLVNSPGVLLAEKKSAGEIADARITRMVPRLMTGIGKCDFPITCRQQETQAFFNQAVACLHDFDAKEADRSFYHVAELESDCAMAWWGLAMANVEQRVLARHYLAKAVERQPQIDRKSVV